MRLGLVVHFIFSLPALFFLSRCCPSATGPVGVFLSGLLLLAFGSLGLGASPGVSPLLAPELSWPLAGSALPGLLLHPGSKLSGHHVCMPRRWLCGERCKKRVSIAGGKRSLGCRCVLVEKSPVRVQRGGGDSSREGKLQAT